MYKFPKNIFGILTENERTIFLSLLRDNWEEFSQENIQEYFDRGHALLLEKVQKLKDLDQEISEEEEKDLHFMVESLSYAKNALRARR